MELKDIQRFMSKVKKTDNCWEWMATQNGDGYGQFRLNGKMQSSHRISYELFKEFIPKGLVINHICRNRKCVNPEHLEVITNKENIRIGESANRNKTHCSHGHEYSKENTYVAPNGWRQCIICNKTRRLEQKEKLKEYFKQRYQQKKRRMI